MLTLPSTRSCGDRTFENGGWGAAVEAIPAVGPLVIVEVHEPIERALKRPLAGEILPAKGDAPMLVQNRFLEALHEAVGPGMSGLRLRDAQMEPLAARGKDALEFLAVVPSEGEARARQMLL